MAATGHAKWTGDIAGGEGTIDTGTGVVAGSYSAASRFGDGKGTNPEELLGAAHAACFSMALTLILGEAGHEPGTVETEARVYLRRTETGFEIHEDQAEDRGNRSGVSRGGLPQARRTREGGLPGLEGPRRT